jgi:hypothetical protein
MPEISRVNFSFSGPVALEKIFKWPHPISDYLSFDKNLALYLNKLEISLPKDNLYQVWLKLTHWFWVFWVFFLISMVLFSLSYYLPLEKGVPFIWTNLNPLPQGWFVSRRILKLAPWFCWRSRKCKNLHTGGQTDRPRTTGLDELKF